MGSKTKRKMGPPLTEKKAKEKLKFHFRLARVLLLLLGRIVSGSSSSPPVSFALLRSRSPCSLFLVFVWLSVCLLGFIVVCLFVYLIIPSLSLATPLGLPSLTQSHIPMKTISCRLLLSPLLFIYLFTFFRDFSFRFSL